MSFTNYLSDKSINESTQEERDAEWKAIKLAIYKESKNLNKALYTFEALVSKHPTLNAEFDAYKKFYPFNKSLNDVANDVQNWVAEMEEEAKS